MVPLLDVSGSSWNLFYHLKKARGRRKKGKKIYRDYKIMLIYSPDDRIQETIFFPGVIFFNLFKN